MAVVQSNRSDYRRHWTLRMQRSASSRPWGVNDMDSTWLILAAVSALLWAAAAWSDETASALSSGSVVSWSLYGVGGVASVDAADYLIYPKDGSYYAQSGATGRNEFSNTDAGRTINSAIHALMRRQNGGSIALGSGVYPVGTTIILQNNICIYGRRGAVLKLNHKGHLMVGSAVEDVVLQGFEIDGNRSAFPRFTIGDPEIYGFGIWLTDGSRQNLISELEVHDCRRDGIIIGNSPNNRINGNRVVNCDGGGIAAVQSNHTIISENYVYRTHYHGIIVTQGANCQVADNKIVEAGYFGLPDEFRHGIAVDSNGGNEPLGCNNVITGNIIIDPRMAGIEVADRQDFCVISNNVVENPASYGIYFGGGIAPSYNATIVGNIVKNAADSGIRVGSPWGDGNITVNATIGNNFVSGSNVHGIHIDTVGNANISSNICVNNNTNGIYVGGENGQLLAYRINVTRDQCYDDRTPKIQQYGIYLRNADYVTVVANQLGDNLVGTIYREKVNHYLEAHNQPRGTSDIHLASFEDGAPFGNSWGPENFGFGPGAGTTVEQTTNHSGPVHEGGRSLKWTIDIKGVVPGQTSSVFTIEKAMPDSMEDWSGHQVVSAQVYLVLNTSEKLGAILHLRAVHPHPDGWTEELPWDAGNVAGSGVPGNQWVYHEWDLDAPRRDSYTGQETDGVIPRTHVSHLRICLRAEDNWADVVSGNTVTIYLDDIRVKASSSIKGEFVK